MKRAILTGFEPFGDYKYNPVQDTTKEYNGKKLEDIEIIGLVLPCTYYGAFEVLSNKINEFSPEIILSSGLASRVERIKLESVGKNIMGSKYADAEGRKPNNEPLIERERAWYSTTSDNTFLARLLNEKKISAEVSKDAESFICNSLIYLTARRIFKEYLPIKFTFFHTPWTDDYLDKVNIEQGKTTIKKCDLKKTIEILIKAMGKSI
jgi:pyroglutamyl-peptidase